jgi:hypothetical protein
MHEHQRSPAKGFNRFGMDYTFTAVKGWDHYLRDRQARELVLAFNGPG